LEIGHEDVIAVGAGLGEWWWVEAQEDEIRARVAQGKGEGAADEEEAILAIEALLRRWWWRRR
jgi:hypothetical protein